MEHASSYKFFTAHLSISSKNIYCIYFSINPSKKVKKVKTKKHSEHHNRHNPSPAFQSSASTPLSRTNPLATRIVLAANGFFHEGLEPKSSQQIPPTMTPNTLVTQWTKAPGFFNTKKSFVRGPNYGRATYSIS